MKKLTNIQIESLSAEYSLWLNDSIKNNAPMPEKFKQNVEFHFPLGEIINLQGFVWVWKMNNQLPSPCAITSKEGFNAQGLEGKMIKETILCDALLYASQCEKFRFAIFTR